MSSIVMLNLIVLNFNYVVEYKENSLKKSHVPSDHVNFEKLSSSEEFSFDFSLVDFSVLT